MNNKELEKYLIDSKIAEPDGLGGYIIRVNSVGSTGGATEATLASVLTALLNVNRTIGFIQSTVNGNTPSNIASFSIAFRGTGGTLNGIPVPENYIANYGNGKDPITNALPYTVPTAGENRVIITILS